MYLVNISNFMYKIGPKITIIDLRGLFFNVFRVIFR